VRSFAHIAFRLPVVGALVAALVLPAAASAAEAPPTADQLDAAGVHEIIVKRRPGLGGAVRAEVRAGAGVTFQRALPLPDTEVVRADPGRLAAALVALRADPDVVYAEPNRPVRAFTSDPYWGEQWALRNVGQTLGFAGAPTGIPDADIDAEQAWGLGTTGAGQTVAVVDTGVNVAHPDLSGQIAASPAGVDYVDNDTNPDDENGHGSHVAGIIAAKQDHDGISGVAPDAKLLVLRVLDATGTGTEAAVASALAYAGQQGVGVVNASLGSLGPSQAEIDAIAAHPDTLYVVAAGNGGEDGIGDDNDVTPTWPCASKEPNVICVGATDEHDRRAGFSNFGATSVDLFAPGVNILSAFMGPAVEWYFMDGTSMAAPEVAGTLALMRAAAPTLSAPELKQALLDAVDPKPQLFGRSFTGGRLNAATAVRNALLAAGKPVGPADTDDDHVDDDVDNCPSFANAGQADADHDGIGDACAATPWGPDADGDGIPDTGDNCPSTANADQADSDADAKGDVCDPSPRGGPDPTPAPDPSPGPTTPAPTPTPTPSTPVAPVLAPAPVTISPLLPTMPVAVSAPVLAPLRAAARTPMVRLCRTAARRCRATPLTVTFRLDRAAAVTAQVQRRACRRSRCRWVTAATLKLRAKPGANRLSLGTRGATAHLKAGSYRLRVVAGVGQAASAVRTLAFRVR
jgi:thermitase